MSDPPFSATERLANHAVSAEQPGPARERLRLLAADYLAIAAAGAVTPSARSALAAFQSDVLPAGALIEGTLLRLPLETAALLNGVSAHGLELDDTHEESSTHPGVVVWPAVLAFADHDTFTVGDVISAVGAGYDVMTASGCLLGAAEAYGRGFHPTAVAGAIGAAAGASRLLRLDSTHTRNALALAADMAAGSLQFLEDGSWTKRLNAGHAAAVGVRATLLARAGFIGPNLAVEGENGWLRLYGRGNVPGRELVLQAGNGAMTTSVKFFACCRYMHGAMDLLSDLHREYPDAEPGDVERIEVAVIGAGQSLVSEPIERKLRIDSPVDAQFSMPFGAALAWATGGARLTDFNDAVATAARIRPWMSKMLSVTDSEVEAAYPAKWTARVAVHLRDGNVVRRSSAAFRGSPSAPATWGEIGEKARELCGDAGDRIVRNLATIDESKPWAEVRAMADEH